MRRINSSGRKYDKYFIFSNFIAPSVGPDLPPAAFSFLPRGVTFFDCREKSDGLPSSAADSLIKREETMKREKKMKR